MTDDTPPPFRVAAVIPVAVWPAEGGPELPARLDGGALAERARVAVARLATWREPEMREALGYLVDAVSALEREVTILRSDLLMARAGIELRPELVHLGEDAMVFQRDVADGPVRVAFQLDVRAGRHMISCDGDAAHDPAFGGTAIAFQGLAHATRDLIVAFAFQQQSSERRRARAGLPD